MPGQGNEMGIASGVVHNSPMRNTQYDGMGNNNNNNMGNVEFRTVNNHNNNNMMNDNNMMGGGGYGNPNRMLGDSLNVMSSDNRILGNNNNNSMMGNNRNSMGMRASMGYN